MLEVSSDLRLVRNMGMWHDRGEVVFSVWKAEENY